MATEASWGHFAVDGSLHRCFRVASWPMLPVGADWLGPLIGTAGATRTVTVVMEPVPTSKAARLADREVMSREADADMKERRGFRVSAKDRKRMTDVMTRETELTEGHPEFRFVGLVDVDRPRPRLARGRVRRDRTGGRAVTRRPPSPRSPPRPRAGSRTCPSVAPSPAGMTLT